MELIRTMTEAINRSISSKTKGYILMVCLFFVFIISCYGHILLKLNQSFFCGDGDGLKTYYNVTYIAAHSNSAFEHQGMAYPNGESIFLEDTMPLFSISLHYLSSIFPGIKFYTVGILNAVFFLGLFLGIVFMYLILLKFRISPLISALASTGIILLSSQNILLFPAGHLGLAYSCFFPSGWYFLMRYYDSPKKLKWSLIIALNTILWGMVHAYLGLILLMFGIILHLFLWLNKKHRFAFLKGFNPLSWIQIIIPLTYYILFYKVFDTHPNRIDMPFIEAHRSTLASVLIPNDSPIKPLLSYLTSLEHNSELSWNKVGSYIGLIPFFTFLLLIGQGIIALFRRQTESFVNKYPKTMWLSFLAATILLIYSFALPLRLIPELYLNQIPFIKQFSSFGRFSWAFYYVLAVFTLIFWAHQTRFVKVKPLILLIVSLGFVLEAIPIHSKVGKTSHKVANSFNPTYLPCNNKVLNISQPDHFQGIIPLPQFYKFCIPFSSGGSDSSIYAAMSASALTGLPIMSTYLSRPSVTESMAIFKMLMPWPYQVEIPEIIKDGRDLAVVIYQPDTVQLSVTEKALLAKCKPVSVTAGYSIYSLSINDLLSYNQPVIDDIVKDVKTDSLWNASANVFWYHNSFDTLKSREVYKGLGAFEGRKYDWNVLFKIPTTQMDTGKTYIISYWYYNKVWDQTFNTAVVNETDSLGQTIQWLYYSPLNGYCIDGWWYFSEYSFKLKSNQSNLALVFKGDQKFENWFSVDEVLIRDAADTVYRTVIQNDTLMLYRNGLLYSYKSLSN